MANYHALKCPECGQDTKFEIYARCTVTIDGTDEPESDGSLYWCDEDTITCCMCRHCGEVGEFHDEDD
jgi:hypothetical protein